GATPVENHSYPIDRRSSANGAPSAAQAPVRISSKESWAPPQFPGSEADLTSVMRPGVSPLGHMQRLDLYAGPHRGIRPALSPLPGTAAALEQPVLNPC